MSLRDRAEAVILPTYPERPLALVRGVGCTVWDEDGNAYLDLVGGLAVNSLGYGHPAAVQALAEQAAVLGHVSNLFYSEPMVALAERLCALSGQDRAFFCNSGAEAVEAAIKLARRAGRGTPRARQAPHRVRRGRLPRAHAGHARRRLVGRQARAVRARARRLRARRRATTSPRSTAAVGPETCAVLVEPIQGEGGVWQIDTEWLQLARELCDRHGALLLYDEVQTGIGRCGAWFCAELSAVRPDAIAVAKGLAGGLPIGALLATDSPTRASSAAITRRRSAARPRSRPRRWPCSTRSSARVWSRTPARSASTSPSARRPCPASITCAARACCWGSSSPDAPAGEVAEALRDAGILVNAITPTALRLVPPLCLSQGEADRFCATFEAVLAARRDQHATTVA